MSRVKKYFSQAENNAYHVSVARPKSWPLFGIDEHNNDSVVDLHHEIKIILTPLESIEIFQVYFSLLFPTETCGFPISHCAFNFRNLSFVTA